MNQEPFDKGFAMRRERLWRGAIRHRAPAAIDRFQVAWHAPDALAT